MLASKVTNTFDHLTSDKRVRAFIIDDSPIARNRIKKAELLARVFDHSQQSFIKGFNMLTLGWTDGYSFVPVDFSMLSSAKETNRYNDAAAFIDKRTHGFKRRLEAVMQKPDVVPKLIKNAFFFKASKSLLKLGTEYQGRSYDMLIVHTTIVDTSFWSGNVVTTRIHAVLEACSSCSAMRYRTWIMKQL